MSKKAERKENPVVLIAAEIASRATAFNRPFIVAIDGKSGAGKTTIAQQVARKLNGFTVLCDDFFVGGHNAEWATKTITEKIDGVIDWRRIKNEVIMPLRKGRSASWHPFNWKKFEGLSENIITAEPRAVVILDGAFTNRPELRDVIDFSVLIEASTDERVARVVKREGEDYSEEWHNTWQESMEYYFREISPPESYNLTVKNN